ncbi:eukaryotic translation initiation factor 4E-binding protein 1-like [Salvelinus alpinus]|uniref:eukaryotic translation initiation factor 4E-binding protein 1-like n=1 Tax=Salvelinus alpinus TaxID=8036 RepID=UPI0039FC2BA8
MPQDYSTTPGGTLFSMIPGGTRIIYDRKFLLECRASPLARTTPCLPDILGVTSPLSDNTTTAHPKQTPNNLIPPADKSAGKDAQFQTDI